MDDTIRRQAAIDEMEEYWRSLNLRRKRSPLAAEAVYMDLKGVVTTLPSAQRKGKWIKNEYNSGWHCSECKEDDFYAYVWNDDTGEYDIPQDNYCPNCGAEMKGEEA